MDGFDHASQARDKTYYPELAYGVDYLRLEEEKLDETEAIEALKKRAETKQLDEKAKQEKSPKAPRDGQEK